MENKSSLNVNTGEHYNASTNNAPAEEFSIGDAPTYSMKKDLELITNPEILNKKSAPLLIPSKPKYASSPKVNSFPMINSPFLETADPSPSAPVSQKKPAPVLSPAKQLPTPNAIRERSIMEKTKTFFKSNCSEESGVSCFGSCYFWLVRGEKPEEVISEEPETIPSIPAPIEESPLPTAIVEPAVKTEEPKENTLVLDIENADSAKIKTAIKNELEKLPQESSGKPVEFKFRDTQNNLIAFSLFAKKSGLAFSQNLLPYLGESFSLFIFNDGPNVGTGLVIESKNDPLLTQEILKEELYLSKDLDVLFLLDVPQKTMSTSFSNFTYRDTTLRFFNLISQEKLSIDYSVAKNKFLIGTTRNTFTALYDWLSPEEIK